MQNKKIRSISSIFKYGSLLGVLVTAISITASNNYLEFLKFSKKTENIEYEYIASQKALMKQEVIRVTDYIELARSKIKQKAKARIKSRVYEAYAIASNIFKEFNGKLPAREVKKLIIEALRPLRFFGGSGYYYINSVDGISQLHALRPELEGRNRIESKISTGRYIVKELRELVRRSGEGFLSYVYRSFENKNIEKPKIAYAKYFEPYDWYIATGDYLESIEKNIQQEMLDYIEQVKFGKNSYIFVVDYQGNMLMHPEQKHLIGTNMSNVKDTNGVNIVKEMYKAVKNPEGDFIYYVWNKPSTSTPSPKATFIKDVKDWQWMIGAGLYIDDIQLVIKEQRQVLKDELIKFTTYIFLISLFIGLVIIYTANKISRKFSSEINLFLDFFRTLSVKSSKINIDSLHYAELRELAVSANRMLDKQIKIENSRARVEESLRASEVSLKEAQRITHFGSWELNFTTNELFWSDEVYRIFELEPGKAKPDYELFINSVYPNDRDIVDRAYSDSVKNKMPCDIEHRIKLTNGKVKRVREHVETIYDEQGNPMHLTGTIQDITELREKEDQLKRSQKMDALGKLTGGIAHDYNNSLGIILGFAELLLLQVKNAPKGIEYVTQILAAGERARALTKKLMAFSRYNPTVPEVININAELKKQQHMIEKLLTARIQLSLNLIENIWSVKLDSGDFNDAIINMAINASHAIESNGYLNITTRNIHLNREKANILELRAGDYVALSIADTGKGMGSQIVTQIFDPFFSTKGEKGTGLGLSQVYGFMQRSEGNIKVESELGSGTEFTLYFPRYYADVILSEKDLSDVSTEKGSETILVVDDEPSLCAMAREILSLHGYHVLIADSARQALEILETETVNLMFSDIIMPNMNGYELADKVAKKYPDISILLTSGYDDIIDLDGDTLKRNIIQKPYLSNELLIQIRDLIDKANN